MFFTSPYNSEEDIKKQYYRLAMEHHPDKAGADATQEIIKERTENMQKLNDEFKMRVRQFRLNSGKSYSHPHGYRAGSFEMSDIDELVARFMKSPAAHAIMIGFFGFAVFSAFTNSVKNKKNSV